MFSQRKLRCPTKFVSQYCTSTESISQILCRGKVCNTWFATYVWDWDCLVSDERSCCSVLVSNNCILVFLPDIRGSSAQFTEWKVCIKGKKMPWIQPSVFSLRLYSWPRAKVFNTDGPTQVQNTLSFLSAHFFFLLVCFFLLCSEKFWIGVHIVNSWSGAFKCMLLAKQIGEIKILAYYNASQ